MQYANLHREDPVCGAVVAIPTTYTYQQKAYVKKAAELAGIELVGLLPEPIAAAIAYGIHVGEIVVVFDLGETLDVSIVKFVDQDGLGNEKYEVLGTACDSDLLGEGKYIGGQDWDNAICELALQKLPGLDANNQYVRDRLSLISEDCKKMLSQLTHVPFYCLM